MTLQKNMVVTILSIVVSIMSIATFLSLPVSAADSFVPSDMRIVAAVSGSSNTLYSGSFPSSGYYRTNINYSSQPTVDVVLSYFYPYTPYSSVTFYFDTFLRFTSGDRTYYSILALSRLRVAGSSDYVSSSSVLREGTTYAVTFNLTPPLASSYDILIEFSSTGMPTGDSEFYFSFQNCIIEYNQTDSQIQQTLQYYANQKLDDIDDKLDDIVNPSDSQNDEVSSAQSQVSDISDAFESLDEALKTPDMPDTLLIDNPVEDEVQSFGEFLGSLNSGTIIPTALTIVASLIVASLLLFGL